MSRGNENQIIFADDHDRRRFVKILGEACERYTVQAFCECRLSTHYHLVVRTPLANISEFMGYLNGEYAKSFHRRHRRTGHLYNERYTSILVDSGIYLRVLLSYVVNNPVKAGLVSHPGEWRWSSYRAIMGQASRPTYLVLDWIETTFPGSSIAESRALFEQYVNAPSIAEAEYCFERAVYGGDDFKKRIRAHIAATLYTSAVPRAYRALHRPPLCELVPPDLTLEKRNSAILRAHVVHAYSLTEIGRYLRMHPASVSRIVCSIRARLAG